MPNEGKIMPTYKEIEQALEIMISHGMTSEENYIHGIKVKVETSLKENPMSNFYADRNAEGRKRQEFFTSIEKMLKEFSTNDINKMRTIVFNEIHSRRKKKDESRGKIEIVQTLKGRLK